MFIILIWKTVVIVKVSRFFLTTTTLAWSFRKTNNVVELRSKSYYLASATLNLNFYNTILRYVIIAYNEPVKFNVLRQE